jgi:hypothetical protein
VLNSQLAQQQAQRNRDEIRDLRAEVAQLRALLLKTRLQHESDSVAETLRAADNTELGQAVLPNGKLEEDQNSADVTNTELSNPSETSPRGYYSQHTLFQFFGEVRCFVLYFAGQSCSSCCNRFHNSSHSSKKLLMNGSNLFGVYLKQNKSVRNDGKTNAFTQEENPLERLLPPQDDTDALV